MHFPFEKSRLQELGEMVSVLYRDDSVLAVDKPAGLLVHQGWGRDALVLVDIVRKILGLKTVHPLHRLDRQTSGVVLFALDPAAAATLGDAFENRTVRKTYWALVRGEPPLEGVIDSPVPKTEGGPRVPALTTYRRLATLCTEPRRVSWVEASPRTGRLHQVRRHLKHISCPVIGDANYGKGQINRAFRERYGLCRMALHAAALTFPHPETGRPCTISAPLPPDLELPLRNMGLD